MAEIGEYTTIFKALSDPLRLKLLRVLPHDGKRCAFCVCDLAKKLGISQPCLSHHLNILRNAGLVRFQKEGCSVFYFVDRERMMERLDSFKEAVREQ
jgi:ArsR family transcriptional regulator